VKQADLKEQKYNLTQGLHEESKLTQHAYEEGHKILWRIEPLLGKTSKQRDNSRCYATARLTRFYNNRVTFGNGVRQLVARQLQEFDYNNGNGSLFYVVRDEEIT
jgi:hypothetical protein